MNIEIKHIQQSREYNQSECSRHEMFHSVSLAKFKTHFIIRLPQASGTRIKIRTKGLRRSPRMSQSSSNVFRPTKITVNSPTNFTLMQEAIMAPVNSNQNHH